MKAYRPIGKPWDAPKPASTKQVAGTDLEDGQKLVAAASENSAAVLPYQKLAAEAGQEVFGGSLILGAVDSSTFQGNVYYQDLVKAAYWMIDQQGLTNNGEHIPGSEALAIFDTGTTLTYLPATSAAALMKSIGATSAGTEAGTTSFTMPCDELAALQLGFSYGGQIFSWDTEDLNLGEVQAGVCMLGVMADESLASPEGTTFGIYGDTMLKSVVSVYDYDNKAVGLAAAIGNPLPVPDTGTSTSRSTSAAGSTNRAARNPSAETGSRIRLTSSAGKDTISMLSVCLIGLFVLARHL